MALTLRRRKQPTKLQRARSIVTTIIALRTLGLRTVFRVAALGAIAAAGVLAARRAKAGGSPSEPGLAVVPPTEAPAPATPAVPSPAIG